MQHFTIRSLPSESEYFSKILYSSFAGNKIATPLLAEVPANEINKIQCLPIYEISNYWNILSNSALLCVYIITYILNVKWKDQSV